ncbi:integrin beta 1 [Paragonimus westermani]|uniref:Integrin beta 1 n=1 Tax=Paragonimus westermani TaxID=34504 RepID=A0A5J4NFS3_9TREM|nr:integrin beta 1 [Paragonimus westermani]
MTTYDSDSLEVQVLTRCNHESGFTEKTVCNDHPVGGRIDYQISVKPKRCFAGKKTVSLKMVALDDQAMLEVEAACNCPTCQRLPTPDYSLPSSRCQSRGYLQCGSCRCHTGFSGDFCECSAETSAGGDAVMIVQCTQEGAKEASVCILSNIAPCSGRGRCTCGKCKCNLARYEGDYCECDRHGCKRASDDNQVCGGPQRGICQCDGTCVCKPGYTGDRCDCMKSVQQCIDPNNPAGPKCSGRGVCDCGQCFCNSGYTGHLCNEIQGGESALCTDRDVERCVLCLRDSLVKAFDKSETTGADDTSISPIANIVTPAIHSNGEVVYTSPEYANAAAVCGSACNGTVIDTARVKLIDNNEQKDDSNLCIIYTDDSCRIFFTYRYSDAIYVNRKVDLNIMRKSECAKTINILYIVLGVVAGIVLGGIILLLIYKLVITIDDRRELAKFEQQGENMRWEMAENPIFESPTTKVINPTYEESGY